MPETTHTIPEEDDFGLPEPPPAPVADREEEAPRGEPPPQALIDLGEPPEDPLECQAYMYRAAVALIRETMLDPKLTSAERRREVSRLMETAKGLVPQAKIWEAVEEIRRDRRELEERRRKPQLVPVPANANPR